MEAKVIKLRGNYTPEFFALQISGVERAADYKEYGPTDILLMCPECQYTQMEDPERIYSELAQAFNERTEFEAMISKLQEQLEDANSYIEHLVNM